MPLLPTILNDIKDEDIGQLFIEMFRLKLEDAGRTYDIAINIYRDLISEYKKDEVVYP